MSCKCYCEVSSEQEVGSVPSEGYAPFFFPAEGALLPFFFTDETFTKVLSSLVNGAIITYGEGAYDVIWSFLQNVEYPVSLCEQIIECITTDSDVKRAIVDMLKADEDFNQWFDERVSGLTAGQVVGKLVEGDCTNSVVAGRALTLVERLDTNNKDFLEVMEVGTNDEERVGDLLEAIPLFDELPIGDAILFIQDVLEDFAENYNAASTTARIEATAEDIYCLMKSNDDCSITFQQLFEYFQQKASSGLTIGMSIQDLLNFVADGDFDSDDLVFYGLMAIQVGFILRGQDFYSLGVPTMGALMRDALPSSIWETWGDCVPDDYTYQWDFTGGTDGGWTLNAPNEGNLGVGGWVAEFFGPFTGIQILKTIPSDANVKRIEVDAEDVVIGTVGAGVYVDAAVGGPSDPQAIVAGTHTYSIDVEPQSGSSSIVVARVGVGNTGSGRLTKIRYYGTSATAPAFTGGSFI